MQLVEWLVVTRTAGDTPTINSPYNNAEIMSTIYSTAGEGEYENIRRGH